MISVIIPANNEEGYIGDCLRYILQSEEPERLQKSNTASHSVQIVVVANGCSDATVAEASDLRSEVAAKGWQLDIVTLLEGSKIKALNEGVR